MKRHIPNFLTCCNLVCGALGVIYILEVYDWTTVTGKGIQVGLAPAYFVWAACVFDFFDGFAARALKVSSPIGKELDSLADVISFGLLPSLFMYKYLQQAAASETEVIQTYLPFIALLIAIFSAVRLAIFNVDETQKDSFRGLPTPANALFITALSFLAIPVLFEEPFLVWTLTGLTFIFSWLMVSPVELFALKFKNYSWSDNKIRFTFLILSVLLIIAMQQAALPLIIIIYVVLSLKKRVVA